ncbi:MAG TPA: methyltransferase domain-containing protein [Vicinamibacterales bacterium]
MSEVDKDFRALLESYLGFDDCEPWIAYARRHRFKPVKAVGVSRCPDCGGAPRSATWGQYIYYSTLIHLLECVECGLVWADAHIAPEVIHAHFEAAYKDQEHFRVSRKPIFDHLVNVMDSLCGTGGRILEIGGALGDLMAAVAARRPDFRIRINDVSEHATNWVKQNLGFATLTGDATVLAAHEEQYDLVVLSDVLYYEPNLRVLWDALSRLTSRGGSILIRVPNKSFLIREWQRWYRLTHTRAQQVLQHRVRFLNPEHIFIFGQRYLRNRLRGIGFTTSQALPSPLLVNPKGKALTSALFKCATRLNQLWPSLVLTPSMVVVGRRQ